jgi:hypothetical protein
MARRYCSFLIRIFKQERGSERIEIRHIQSGAKTCVTSEAEAVAWMRAQLAAPAPDRSDGKWPERKST